MKNRQKKTGLWLGGALLVLLAALILLLRVSRFPPLLPAARQLAEQNGGGYLHLSVDDTNNIFADLTGHAADYDTAFENPSLHFLKELHETYGVTVSMYCFYSWDIAAGRFDLSQATDAFAADFTANADWLKFGFHAKDAPAYETLSPAVEEEYYQKTVSELLRITGSPDCIDHFVRLDRYTADEATVQALAGTENGVCGLLCSQRRDPLVISYALTEAECEQMYADDGLYAADGLLYMPTDLRFEELETDADFMAALEAHAGEAWLIAFTHEGFLADRTVQKYMDQLAQYAVAAKMEFGFPQQAVKTA